MVRIGHLGDRKGGVPNFVLKNSLAQFNYYGKKTALSKALSTVHLMPKKKHCKNVTCHTHPFLRDFFVQQNEVPLNILQDRAGS